MALPAPAAAFSTGRRNPDHIEFDDQREYGIWPRWAAQFRDPRSRERYDQREFGRILWGGGLWAIGIETLVNSIVAGNIAPIGADILGTVNRTPPASSGSPAA